MKLSQLPHRSISMTALAVSVALAAGCSSSNKNAALLHADKVYADARGDTTLIKNEKAKDHMAAAATALNKAKSYDEAIEYFGEEPVNPSEINTLAYVSEQNVLAAKLIASKDSADAELAQLRAERDSALRAKNDREAARLAADAAAQQERERTQAALLAALANAQKGGAEVQQTADEIKVTFRELTFDVNKANIKPEFQSTLDELAVALRQRYPNAALEISGHTDSTGSEEYNAKLSEQRAISVKTFMIGKGLSSERLASRGLGESSPVASNATAEGRAKNRRVELVVKGVEGQ